MGLTLLLLEDDRGLRTWLTYVLTGGQEVAAQVDFARLPESLRVRALAQVEKIHQEPS